MLLPPPYYNRLPGAWRHQDAFTLIELLVVIAVVGVLVAMATPLIGKAREVSNNTRCINNLRQIASGLGMYVLDNGGMMPPGSSENGWAQQSTTWGYAIWPYVYGNRNAFKFPENDLQISATGTSLDNAFSCPSAVRGTWVAVTGGEVSASHFSYGLNNGVNGISKQTRSAVSTPAKTALVVESSTPRGDYYSFFTNGTVPHMGKTNVLFFDGHVESLQEQNIPRKLSTPFWTINAE